MKPAPDHLQLGLEQLLNELQSHQLQTILAPSKRSDRREWDMIRVNMDENPRWYRNFCARHPSTRGVRRGKFDTVIRRIRTEQTLKRLIAGKHTNSIYADELLRLAAKVKIHAA